MQEITLKSIIETAIRAEELGINYYSELAKRFHKNAEIKEMFELLAKDEVLHKKQFNDLLSNLNDFNVAITELDKSFMSGVDISKFFKGMESVDNNAKPEEVLKNAFEFEKESVLFYSGLRDIIGENKELDEIIKLEKQHMTSLLKYIIDDAEFRGIQDSWT